MKKLGFTLAEILIVLTIIGVIAAITLPTLMTNTSDAQIGPKLAKARAAFEQANTTLLNANSVDLLTDGGYTNSNYLDELSKYLKGAKGKVCNAGAAVSCDGYIAADGMSYCVNITKTTSTNAPGYQQQIGTVAIDINGPKSKKNIKDSDVFEFNFMNDGSLIPPKDSICEYIFTHNLKVPEE